MNAYELAEIMEIHDGSLVWEHGLDIANMLRQQADRIAELEKVSKPVAWIDYLEHSDLYDLNVSGRGIPLYTAPQIKELSDEDIEYITKQWFNCRSDTKLTEQFVMPLYSVVNLCKAILKKASEK